MGKEYRDAAEFYQQGHDKGDGYGIYLKRLYYRFSLSILATRNLGLCYEWGRGVEKDEVRAFELYKEAVQRKNYFGFALFSLCMAHTTSKSLG